MSSKEWLTFDCTFCQATFYSEHELKEHYEEYHIYRCYVCSMGFYYENDMMHHMKEHDEIHSMYVEEGQKDEIESKHHKTIECEKCKKTFRDTWHKERHLQSQTSCSINYKKSANNRFTKAKDKKSSQCEICDKTFNSSWHLGEHMTVHSDEKQFKCDECESQFKRKDSLRRHRKKINKCDECEATQSCTNGLRKHKLNNHGNDNLPSQSGNVTAEVTSRAQLRDISTKHTCFRCGYVARDKDRLSRHTKNVLACDECHESFCGKDAMKWHKLKVHREKTPKSVTMVPNITTTVDVPILDYSVEWKETEAPVQIKSPVTSNNSLIHPDGKIHEKLEEINNILQMINRLVE